MKKISNILGYLILLFSIIFNLWLNFPETKILADPNDNIFQYSLIARTEWVWKNYGCPLSLSCLPNLTDHVVTAWAEGYPLPIYYSHVPQILTVSSYHLLIKPIVSLFNPSYSLYQYYNLTKYLLMNLFPIPVFIALRLVGFSPLFSALGAFFSSHFSTDGLYGIDPPSYLWRGWGLTSQLYAVTFMPLALAFVFRALKNIDQKAKNQKGNPTKSQNQKKSSFFYFRLSFLFSILKYLIKDDLLLAVLFLTLTTAGHLGIGIIALLSTIPFLFLDANFKHILARIKKLLLINTLTIILLSYWIFPLLLSNNYHMISFWDPIWKFDSYGWYEVVRQFFQGEIFDWLRAPIITAMVTIGFFALLANSRLFSFSVLFAMWMLAYFGRSFWGGLIDLIPAMKDFHQHRFIVGVHCSAIFLLPAAMEFGYRLLEEIAKILSSVFIFISAIVSALLNRHRQKSNQTANTPYFISPSSYWKIHRCGSIKKIFSVLPNTASAVLFLILIIFLGYQTAKQTVNYASFNNRWIGEANRAYLYDEKNFNNLVAYLKQQPKGRIYAGRPGNWGKQFRLGSTEMYMLFGITGLDTSQFLPETWSPLSENEQNFDERILEDYDLLNIRYIVAEKNHEFPTQAKMDKKFGPFELYFVPTTGWFDVVTSPMLVKTDKTNFINLVHYWHRTYPRRWKMHPLISVEKKVNTPFPLQRSIAMDNEVTYAENGQMKNIFADFPLVFPESTPSGKIIKEKVEKQKYTATVQVPSECNSCLVMFKMSYHPNWRVKIDGKKADKYAVFPFYLATYASAGTHEIQFYYQPSTLKVILLAGELFIAAVFLFYLLFKRSAFHS